MTDGSSHQWGGDFCVIGDIGPETQWNDALQGVEDVVHLAAKVHDTDESTAGIYGHYRRANVEGTETLARAAASAGVRRFIYMSSIKVNGESTPSGSAFIETDRPKPQDAYGQSKWDAEQALAVVSRETGMEVVVLRPPLVYGPGVKANFLSLLNLIDRGWPLPLASLNNVRSLILVDNLAHAVKSCLQHPAAAGRTFLLADAAISVANLVRMLAQALGRRSLLLPVPMSLLRGVGAALGKGASIEKLTSSLVIDDRAIREALGWAPPMSLPDGIRITCDWYQSASHGKGRRAL